MGQEIFYCCQCQGQIRSADFTKGGALKLEDRACCMKCGPSLLATLTPQEQEQIFREAAKLKATTPGPGTSRAIMPLPSVPVVRPSPARTEGIPVVVWGGMGALILLVVGGIFLGGGRTGASLPPGTAAWEGPRPQDPKPGKTPPATGESASRAKSSEELREQVAGRKLGEIQAWEKSGHFAPDEVRRRYAEFAREYPDTAQGKTIAAWVKAQEPKPEEPVVAEIPKPENPQPEVPKPPQPEPPQPVVKPPEPAPADPVVKPPPSPPKHPAVPDAAKIRDAEAAVRKALPIDQAKTSRDKADLARTLLQTAANSGAKDAELYILLRMARDLAAQGMDVKTALEAIDARAGAFDVDAMGEKGDLFAKTTAKGQDATAWSGAALDLAQEASEADDYETAVKLAARAEVLARAANEKGLQETAKERSKELVDLKRVADGLKACFKTLETKPGDAAANVAVGKFLSLVKGEWKRGLPMLAKGSEPALKNLAEQELANPTDPAAQAALGEAWAAQAEKETPIYKARGRERAAEWLGRAIPGLTGLAKVSAERKLASMGPITGPKGQLTLDLGVGVKMEMVYLKPGTFTMGSTETPKERWQVDERPEHRVTITKGFYLGKYAVTQAQWEAVTGKNPSKWKGPDLPVEQVSWEDCQDFLKKLNEKAKNQLKNRVVAMPTEAQWEYACRAGTKTRWSFGDDEKAMVDYGWTNANSGAQTHPVGQKKPNAWGLFDMHGNVWEWCQDWAGPYSGDVADPTGPADGSARCLRGGSLRRDAIESRSAIRSSNAPTNRSPSSGFRACLS